MASTKRNGRLPVVYNDVTGELEAISDDNIDWDPFARLPLPMLVQLFKFKEWSPTEIRLLFYLLAVCDQSNMIHMTSGEIREALGVTQAQMSNAVSALVDKNIVTKARYVGRSFYFMLNPSYFRRFEEKLLLTYMEDYAKARAIMCDREGRDFYWEKRDDYYSQRKEGKAFLKGERKKAKGAALTISAAADEEDT